MVFPSIYFRPVSYTHLDTVIRQLEVLPAEMIIQRLTGDGLADDLIAPQWTRKKVCVLNEIDKEMARRDTWQSRKYRSRID